MRNKETDEVLRQIFNPTLSEIKQKVSIPGLGQPGFEEIESFAALLTENTSEEDIQQFLAEKPHFLFRSMPVGGDSNVAFLTKPPIGTAYKADFAVLTCGQGGCHIELIQLKKPMVSLFTKQKTPAKDLQLAIGQVQDWHHWIEENRNTFMQDMLRLAKSCPIYPQRSKNKSFVLYKPAEIERMWQGFSGFQLFRTYFLIVIGRWGLLPKEHQTRLIFQNQQFKDNRYIIRTYDQLIRRAYDGAPIPWETRSL